MTPQNFNLILALIGGLILVLGLFSQYFRARLHVSEPLAALILGIILGPLLDILHLEHVGDATLLLEEGARLTLAVALVGVAMRLPGRYVFKSLRPLLLMLCIVMPLMWLISSVLVWAVLGTSVWGALLIGGVVTPTDPVLSSSIVSGQLAERYIPARIRNLVLAESGANDGLALPLVMLAVLFLTKSTGEALSAFLVNVLLWEVLGALAIGAVIGLGAGVLLRHATKQQEAGHVSVLTMGVAMAVFALGFVKWLGSDGILAAFVAGVAFNAVVKSRLESELEDVQEVVSRFFLLPTFVFFGAALPWEQWWDLGWRAVVLVIGILLLRRIPPMLLLYRGLRPIYNLREALFVGWFGPVGVAALFYATLAVREAHEEMAWTVGSLVICASVVVHGITATWFTRKYGETSEETS